VEHFRRPLHAALADVDRGRSLAIFRTFLLTFTPRPAVPAFHRAAAL